MEATPTQVVLMLTALVGCGSSGWFIAQLGRRAAVGLALWLASAALFVIAVCWR